jgi:hypothetical protein
MFYIESCYLPNPVCLKTSFHLLVEIYTKNLDHFVLRFFIITDANDKSNQESEDNDSLENEVGPANDGSRDCRYPYFADLPYRRHL